jgi:Ca-activated chloride channel family protein
VLCGLLTSTAIFGPTTTLAQSRPFRSGVELVPLTVTVTDRAGRHVPNLTAADFAVFEEGQRQTLSHFAADHVPLDVGFLIDTSSSMRDTLTLARKAACGLVRQLRAGDRGAVSGIGSQVVVYQSMTPDLARVDAALRATSAYGNTALYDAVYIALRQYQQERSQAAEVRRQAIVLLSDGRDTASHVLFEDLLDLVRRVDVTIYVVSLATDISPAQAAMRDRASADSAHALRKLATESGGWLFTPRQARELPAIYDAIADELRNQYVIGYLPATMSSDGAFRRVSVGVLGPRGGTARTRAGYYGGFSRAGSGVSTLAASVVR